MENQNSQGISQGQLFKFLVVIAALFALLTVAIYLSTNSKRQTAQEAIKDAGGESAVVKRELPSTQIPDLFPDNLPIEPNAQVIANFDAQTVTGNKQASRTYLSSKTLSDSLKVYESYFTSNGWQVAQKVNTEKFKMISATKGYLQMVVNLNLTPESDKTTVSLSIGEK